MRISKNNVDKYEQLQESMDKIMHKHGDHYTFVKIFENWRSNRKGDKYFSFFYNFFSWAKLNQINIRALKQANNIRDQIKTLTQIIDYKIVEKSLREDPIFRIYRKKRQEISEISLWKRVSMSLCSSFYYNSARRIHNANEEYMLLAEGNILNIDHNSAFSVRNNFPEIVIFTELAGRQTGRGTMRSLSEVKEEWVLPYMKKIKKISGEQISGVKSKKSDLMIKREKTQKLEHDRKEGKEDKLLKARERFMNRCKIRQEIKKK